MVSVKSRQDWLQFYLLTWLWHLLLASGQPSLCLEPYYCCWMHKSCSVCSALVSRFNCWNL